MSTAVMILMLIVGSVILGHFIAVTSIPQKTADWVVTLPVNRYVILLMICIMYVGRLFHRRPRLHDPRHAYLLPGSHETRLRPHLVRNSHRRRRYDRRGYSSGRCLRFCGKKHHQGAHGPDIPRCGPIPDRPLSLSGDCCSSFRSSLSGFPRVLQVRKVEDHERC